MKLSTWSLVIISASCSCLSALLVTGASAQTGPPQTARGYYNELYKAGGLDHMADGYVCFDDRSDLLTFFIFGDSKVMRQFLLDAGGYSKLNATQRAQLDKGFLNVRQYDKGVPLSEEIIYVKDNDSWVTERFNISGKNVARQRIALSWQTLRYKKTVELQQPDGSYHDVYSGYGRCEIVSDAIRQTGN
jgi:hypothetical protein